MKITITVDKARMKQVLKYAIRGLSFGHDPRGYRRGCITHISNQIAKWDNQVDMRDPQSGRKK